MSGVVVHPVMSVIPITAAVSVVFILSFRLVVVTG